MGGGGGQLVAKLAYPHRGDFYFPIRRAGGWVVSYSFSLRGPIYYSVLPV
jgi:hypothetical protein